MDVNILKQAHLNGATDDELNAIQQQIDLEELEIDRIAHELELVGKLYSTLLKEFNKSYNSVKETDNS